MQLFRTVASSIQHGLAPTRNWCNTNKVKTDAAKHPML